MTAAFQINILLVDDDRRNLLALEAVLENPQYRLVLAASGEDALKALLRDDFAVILMDVMMPGMNGFEAAQIIRNRDRSRYTPIIFVTAVETSEANVTRGYSVGGVDYLFKPIVPEVLRSKVAAFAELFRKTEEVKRQERRLRELERREHEAKMAEAARTLEAERLRYEIDLARQIQQHLFPKKSPQWPGIDVAGTCLPADAAGGDYFDYIASPAGHLDVVIADVAGHGVGPALLMAATRAYLRALAPLGKAPGEILRDVNRALAQDMAAGQFVTLMLVRISTEPLSLVYASAGHNPAYLLDGTGEVKVELASTGLPLGVVEETSFETSPEIPLDGDDLVFMYTDGVVEALAPDEEPFGVERALDLIRQERQRPAIKIAAALQSAIAGFTQTETRQDDITTVVLRVQP